MKQCPKCSVTYANDKQKFCTKDGTPLVDAVDASAGQGETVRIDSAQLDDEITKVISQQLPQMSGSAFDPYKTQVSTAEDKAAAPPAPSQPVATPTPSAATPTPSAATPTPSAATPTPPVATPTPPAATPTPPAATPTPPVATPTPSAATPTPSAATPSPVTSDTAGIGAQATNASIPAHTVPAVAVPPTPQAAPVAAAMPQPPPPAKKRSKLPLILGILFVLFVIGAGAAVAGYFFVAKPMLDKRRVAALEPRRPEPTPIVVSAPEVNNPKPEAPKIEVPPYSPPANAVQFVNSKAKLTGKLADHYVDFSFYYPDRWQKDPEAGTGASTNFAKVQRQLAPDAPQEIFAVGWYDSTGARDTDEISYPRLVAERSAQFAKTYPEYTKISDGPAKVGPYDAYEFRFKGMFRNTERGDVQIWGRVMFVPPLEGNRGVTLLMLASSLATEVKSIDDVGIKGDLPMMLESFRFGK